MNVPRVQTKTVAIFLCGMLLARCGTLSVPEEPPRPTPAQPLWLEDEVRDHLRFFSSSEVDGRVTATEGYATAAAYVAARMRESRVQPVLDDDHRILFPTSLNDVRTAEVTVLRPDTVSLVPGLDFLPDARSDSGRVTISEVAVLPAGGDVAQLETRSGTAVVVSAGSVTSTLLDQLRQAGAQAVFVLGSLVPGVSVAPVDDLVILQVAPDGASALLGLPPEDLSWRRLLDEPVRRRLPHPVLVSVNATWYKWAGAVNVMGFVPGKWPDRTNEAILVLADLDAVGPVGGVPTIDVAHLGTGAAAVLEVARHYGYIHRYWPVPQRTIIYGILAGGRLRQAGLKHYLAYPLWPLDKTRAVIYVGLREDEEEVIREWLAPHGLPLYVVRPSQESVPPLVLSDRPDGDDRASAARPIPRLKDLIEEAVPEVLRMAEETHMLLLREAVTPASFVPVREDTLTIPDVYDVD